MSAIVYHIKAAGTMYNRSNLLQIVAAVWLATLLCILVLRYADPSDPWVIILSRPLFLVIAPIVVAFIPVLGAKSFPKKSRSIEESGVSEERSGKSKEVNGNIAWKMALVWLTSFVIFAAPHHTTPVGALDFIWHNPWFLLTAPLLLACIPLPSVLSKLRQWGFSYRPTTDDSPYMLWKGLIACILLGCLLILCLIGVNSMKGAVGKFSVNIAISVLLVGDVAAIWIGLRRRRRRQH